MTKGKNILFTGTLLVVGLYFLFLGLSKTQEFLGPLAIALVLALLMIPLSNIMENKTKINRAFSSLISTFLLFLFSLGVFAVLSFQIKSFVDDWNKIKETMKPKIEQAESFLYEHTALSKEDLEQYREQKNISSMASDKSSGEQAYNFLMSAVSFFSNYLLTFIYIFFLLNYRRKFKIFFLKLAPDEQQDETKKIINRTSNIAQDYLVGKLLLIFFLAVIYSIGLGISGVNNFILISIIAAFLSLIPYLGNIVGFFLALSFGFLTSGETGVLIGIIITFAVAQFIESYILEPYVVGDKVDLHPFIVILAVIVGNMVWGVLGMVLAIPLLGILNVVLRNVKPLKPYGYLLSNEEENSN